MTASVPEGPVRTVHLVDAHLNYPGWSEGDLNRAMIEVAKSRLVERGLSVTETRIEDGVDADREVQRYVEADLVILQTPINWFGPPWIFKRYVDEVFNAGLHSKVLLDNDGRTRADPSRQYGTGGHMHGRGFFTATTWTAPSEAFDDPGQLLFRGKGVDDLLLNVTANYRFVGFDVLEGYQAYDIYHRSSEVAAAIEGYGPHIDRQIDALDALRAAGEVG